MNIGISANFLVFEKAGVGKYSRNIIKNLFKIDSNNHYFLYFSFLRHKKERIAQVKKILGGKHKNVTIRVLSIPAAWMDYITTLPIDSTKFFTDEIDVFFAPYVSGIPKKGFTKSVAMVHDLVFLRYPEHRGGKLSRYYLLRHKIVAQNCKILIAPSNSTKKDIIHYLNVPAKKIKVIPEAADERFRVISDQKKIIQIVQKYIDPKINYILSVGTLEPRKNLNKLVEAYSLLPHELKRQYKLVICGGKGWNNSSLFKIINDLNLVDNIIFPGFVADEDLPYIYNKASIFVYPALYEGFGLPPLEALACGVPVISSNLSSLPEVLGKAAFLINPLNEQELASAIKKVLLKPALAQKMRLKGPIQAKKYSWEKAAQETLRLFEQIGKN